MIRGVLFDYGGVIAEDGRGVKPLTRLASLVDLSEEEAAKHIKPLWRQFIRGQLTTDEFWHSVGAFMEVPVSPQQRQVWKQALSTVPYPEMQLAVANLQASGYQVGLLSNITSEARDDIAAAGTYSLFDFTVLSCDVKVAKPEPEIFQLALDKFTNLRPEEIVFIDDYKVNLPPAEALGLQTILAANTEQVIADLRKLELPV